ncbi:MaoC family dehydratase [Halorarius litoreus]|uniref:MaoC family dehydratase n=1 Tax=Halorarius litoreus TaxID=2962676 RepID=UPI0020CC07B2|nr:MaoC family dehydratase [Halorarius litoreus]
MVATELEGTEIPSGEFGVEGWKAYLWADATRDEEAAFRYDEDAEAVGEPGQLVPHSMCQHIVFEATGGIEATMSRLTDDWKSGAALGGLRVEFHAPIETGTTLTVDGAITSVVEKEGSSGGLTIVTHEYAVSTPDGDAVYDLEADMVLLEDL